ncbi:unnamed protein product [Rotaria magnacalcarata]|uniref:Uncharacterized protein n=3 Tax=Rotaria magnacalcarata TaxID=392030 RepID=A0A816CG19_9BILA|nr:unnamed protein product [Rotaria magnacalcarata]CAF4062028.1 unnamed protein product [Rotaria magnacalcarata]
MSKLHNHGTRFAIRQASETELKDSPMRLPNNSESSRVVESSLNEVSSLPVHEPSSFHSQKTAILMNKQKQLQARNLISPLSRSIAGKKGTTASKTTASSIEILPKQKNKPNDSTATKPTSTNLLTIFSTSPTVDESSSKTTTLKPISLSSKTVCIPSTKYKSVGKTLTTTDAVGMKKTSTSTITKMPSGISLIRDLQNKNNIQRDIIKDLKLKLVERDKTIAHLHESSITVPTEPLVIDWINHMYELVHKEEIKDQINYESYAKRLNMDENTLKNCILEDDRVKTAREIVRNFPDYQEIINMNNAWQWIDKEQISIVLEFIRQQFGASLSKTDQVVRMSLSTMVRTASWKVRGDTGTVNLSDNAAQLSGECDGHNGEVEEEEEEEE